MIRRTHQLGAAAVTTLALAAPAAASAVTVSANQGCYSHLPTRGSEPVVLTLAGGTPNANFLVAATAPGKGSGSAGSASGTFDAAGNATTSIENVSTPTGSITPSKGQVVQLSVKDFGAGAAEQPAGQILVTNIALSVALKPTSPRARRTVRVSGTPFAGKRLYGFITKGGSTRVLKRISLGTANGCGYVSTRAVVGPPGFRVGTYRFSINAGKKLDKPNAIFGSFRIFRTTR